MEETGMLEMKIEFVGECRMLLDTTTCVKNTVSGEDEGSLSRCYIECDDILYGGKSVLEMEHANLDPDKRVRFPCWFAEFGYGAVQE